MTAEKGNKKNRLNTTQMSDQVSAVQLHKSVTTEFLMQARDPMVDQS